MKHMEQLRYASYTYSNVSALDRVARLGLSTVLIAIPLLEPTETNMLMMLAAIPLVMSAIMAWDPMYALFKIRTATFHAQPAFAWGRRAESEADGPNVGMLDRIVRLSFGAALLSVPLLFSWLESIDTDILVFATLAAIPIVLTSAIGWDPIYQALGLRTATLSVDTAKDYGAETDGEGFELFDAEPAPG